MDEVGTLAMWIAAAFPVGFVAGYAVRAAMSAKRHRRAQRRLCATARPFILPEPTPELSDSKLDGVTSPVGGFGPASVDIDTFIDQTMRPASNISGSSTSNATRGGNSVEDFEVLAPAPHENEPDSPSRKFQLH